MSETTFNTPLPAVHDFLMNRRSVKTKDMTGPGPDREAVRKILEAGMRVPDHGKIAPWRFIVLDNETDQESLGVIISEGLCREREVSEKVAEKMKGYATQAPVLIVAISSPVTQGKAIPVWEQELSMGAACMNMLVSATALGFAGQWLTGWASYNEFVKERLGLTDKEQIAGFMFFGSQTRNPSERPRPDFEDHVTYGMPV